MKDKVNKIEVAFLGEMGWKKFRDFLVLKMNECEDEKSFTKLFELMMASMFSSVDEMNEVRRKMQMKVLTKKEELDAEKKFQEKR
jgi:hypothetical protein